MLGRLVGWLLLLFGLVVLGRDLLARIDVGFFEPIVLGKLWFDLSPGSLERLQPAVRGALHPLVWDDLLQPLLLWPAFPTLLAAGAVLLLLCRVRETGEGRRRRRR